MKFTSTIIAALCFTSFAGAFAPSSFPQSRSITSTQRNVAVTADDINAKLAAQMQKLREKDATSPKLNPDVSKLNIFNSM